MKVMMIVKATQQSEAPGALPSNDDLVAMGKFNEELQKAGVLLDLTGLTPSSRGARITYSGKERKVVDGPFAEAKELIAGYWVIQVKTFAEAVEWAKRIPFGTKVQVGEEPVVELRPLFEMEDFAPGEGVERAKALGEKLGKS